MPGKYEIKRAKNHEYYFNLKAANGETILTSETYKAKASAKNGIKSVMTNSPREDRYERRASPSGKFFFVLKAANREVIGRSEMYESEASRDNGIESVKTNGPAADLIDMAA
ncbi:MAG: YegP family protein [Terriglobia bacterium]